MLHAGPEQGMPIVLLHGIPASAELWRAIITTLAESGYQVFAPDLPGYGFTRLPEDGDFSLAGAADILAGSSARKLPRSGWLTTISAGVR